MLQAMQGGKNHTPKIGATGIALPAALFGLIMISLLATGIWITADQGGKAELSREEGIAAVQLAEAGKSHALALLRGELRDTSFTRLLRGDDNDPNTADDGILAGYGLDVADEIPAAGRSLGGGTYAVQVVDDPADGNSSDWTDDNDLVVLRCTGTTSRGGSATIDVTVGEAVSAVPTGFVFGGYLKISGNLEFTGDGECDLHVNGDLDIHSDIIVDDEVSSSGNVSQGGNIETSGGDPVSPEEGADTQDVPDLDVWNDLCNEADYLLKSDGWIEEVATGDEHDARSSAKFGWKRSGGPPEVKWEYDTDSVNEGTFCVQGNAYMSNSPGKGDSQPGVMSVLATESIEVSGDPWLQAAHPDDYLFVAEGDLSISGNPGENQAPFSGTNGLLYAGSQCKVSGNPWLNSKLQCRDDPAPADAINFIDQSEISGNPKFDFSCSSGSGGGSAERQVINWLQRYSQ